MCINILVPTDYEQFTPLVNDAHHGCYFATPPSIFGDICAGLKHGNAIDDSMRVVLEKPIGHDLETSKVINETVAEYFSEKQIYRIDHYLGKETVLNLISLRFANSVLPIIGIITVLTTSKSVWLSRLELKDVGDTLTTQGRCEIWYKTISCKFCH